MTFKHNFNCLLKLNIAIFLFCLCKVAFAIEMSDLFSAQFETQADTAKERTKLINHGFDFVLAKLCLGSAEVATNSKLIDERTNLKNYTLGYSYEKVGDKLFLNIQYSDKAIKNLLHRLEIPYLSEKRPAVVFWLAIDEANYKPSYWVGDNGSKMVRYIESRGEELGLPFVLPLFDYADLSLRPEQIELDDEKKLVGKAIDRYHTDIIAVGKLSEFAGKWKSSVNIHMGNEVISVRVINGTMKGAIDNIISSISSNLLNKYAVGKKSLEDEAHDGDIAIEIAGLNSLPAYNKVVDYLRGLPGVTNVQPEDLVDDKGVFILTHNQSKHALLRSIKLDKLLIEDSNTYYESESNGYRFKVSM
jgi:uncharacterized protein